MSQPTPSSREETVAALRAAFVKVTGQEPAGDFCEQLRLRDDLGLDSFAALELLFELEDRLGVRIPKEAAVGFQTVADVVSFVVSLPLAAPAAASPASTHGAAP